MSTDDQQILLLEDTLLQKGSNTRGTYTGDGSVDFHGRPVLKAKTGNWKACLFILGCECCERLAFFGIDTNLVNYLTGKLHQGNVSAARIVTTWSGTCSLTPLLGAFLADAYWGRYWTIGDEGSGVRDWVEGKWKELGCREQALFMVGCW